MSLLAALVAWSFLQRFCFLSETQYPVGVDGYFYPIQLRSLLEGHGLYYPSSPLVLWFMVPFAAVTGPVVGAKIAAALGAALLAVPMYILGRRLCADRTVALLCAGLAVTSAESFYLTAEFVKSGLALTLSATFVCVLLWTLERPSSGRITTAVGCFCAVLLAHKLAAAIALLLAAPSLVIALKRRNRRPLARREPALRGFRLALLTFSPLMALLLLGWVLPYDFSVLRDLTALASMFTASADVTLPVLDQGHGDPLYFGHEVAISGTLGLAAILLWFIPGVRDHQVGLAQDRGVALGAALLAVALACPWLDTTDPQGMAFRLRLVAFVPLALCAARCLGVALMSFVPAARVALVLTLAVGWMASRPVPGEGVVTADPRLTRLLKAFRETVPKDDVLLVPERHVMFMATWYTKNFARLRPEAVPPERRWRLIPDHHISPILAAAIQRARTSGDPNISPPLGSGLVLMSERTWRWVMQQVPEETLIRYERWDTI